MSVTYAHVGVDFDRAAGANWVGTTNALRRLLAGAIHKHRLAAHKLHADDTPVPGFILSGGKPETGYL